MRTIIKRSIPLSFTNKTEALVKWSEYHDCCFKHKQALKRYMLSCEQNYLCIYCESKVTLSNESSHIEHIRPKAQDMYPELTFEYTNLAVSCNGTCFNLIDDDSQYNCGHIKDNKYEEEKFIHPFEILDIEEYFKYDFDDFKIYPTNKNITKSDYMINTLKLNSGRLVKARENTYKSFNKKMKKIKNTTKRKEVIKKHIDLVEIQFVSLFKDKYKNLFT